MTSRSPRKIAGCCTLCDKPQFEILRKYTEGPRAGEPADFGKPAPEAHRITFLLADGSTTDMTFCESCAGDISFSEVWRRNMAAFAFEHREALGLRSLNEEQRDQQKEDLLKLADNIPLAVLANRRWSEIWPS